MSHDDLLENQIKLNFVIVLGKVIEVFALMIAGSIVRC